MGTSKFETAQKRRILKERVVAYKGGSCQICKYDKSLAALELHHLDGRDKDFAISSKMTSWEAIFGELDKCVLLCCRCHREVHDGWHPAFLTLDGSERGYDILDDPLDDYEEELS